MFPLSLKENLIIFIYKCLLFFKCPNSPIYNYRMKENGKGISCPEIDISLSNLRCNMEGSGIHSVSHTATLCSGPGSLENPY